MVSAMDYFDNISSKADLKKEYRRLCAVLHPDKGGDKEKFATMRKKYLDKLSLINDYCTSCDGLGYIRSSKGFINVDQRCENCSGSGDMPRVEDLYIKATNRGWL